MPDFDIKIFKGECGHWKSFVKVDWGDEFMEAESPKCYETENDAVKAANELIEAIKKDVDAAYRAVKQVIDLNEKPKRHFELLH